MLVERGRIGAQLAQFGFEVLQAPFEGAQIDRFRRDWFRQGFKTDLGFLQQTGFLLEQLALPLFQLGFLDAAGGQALQGDFDQIIGRALHEFPASVLLVVGQENQPVIAEVDDGLRHVPPEDFPSISIPKHVPFDPRRAESGIQFRRQGDGRLFEVTAGAVAETQDLAQPRARRTGRASGDRSYNLAGRP